MALRQAWLPVTVALGGLTNGLIADDASAHVKWFCAFDVAGQPRSLENVLCANFELLVGAAILILLAGCLLERMPMGVVAQRALDQMFGNLQAKTELMFRVGCAFFFVSIWAVGGILLTPELKTDSATIGWLQLAIAAGMLSRQTMPLSGLGIAVLFAVAITKYGIFHLADYPIFLGIGAYLTLVGLQRDLFGMRPLDVVRWAAAITLMWASIEKWAYPEWSFPLLADNPSMTFGYNPEFFMQAAGVIEFTLAFTLIWTPLVRRTGALLLSAMFIAAIPQFGKIDAIGHALIIVALLAIVADTAPEKRLKLLLMPATYAIALAGFLTVYYISHTVIFGTTI
jgi:hypothetical protein